MAGQGFLRSKLGLSPFTSMIKTRSFGAAAAALELQYEDDYDYYGGYDDRTVKNLRWNLHPMVDGEGSEPRRGVQWVIIGEPGAKKHVYAEWLSKLLEVPHISMADLLRQQLHPRSSVYKQVSLEEFGGDSFDYSGQFATSEQFLSDSNAISWAKKAAMEIGFELIISSHKNNGMAKLLKCNRGERYRGALRDLDSALRKSTKTKACKCPFRIKVEKLYDSNSWIIVPKTGEHGTHNHGLIVYPEGHRQISGLSLASKVIVRDMIRAQAKPCSILAAVQEKYLEDNPTRRHIYNYRDKMRRDQLEDRDVIGQFYQLTVTNKYVHWTQANPETHVVTHVFMAHHAPVNLLRTYRWYIGIDCTFKTNKYKMPLLEIIGMTPCNKNLLAAYAIMSDETEASYSWVLQRLKILIGYDVSPTVIVTDRELGLMTPISEVFPDSAHLLCTWHINKDVEDRVYRLCGKNKELGQRFKNGKWKKVMTATTQDEFDSVVTLMRLTWANQPNVLDYVTGTWLKYKEMFVVRWTNDVLHLGNTTNCRVESAHAVLKQWLNSSTGALDTVWTKVDKEISSQLIQIRYQLEESRYRCGVTYSGFPFNYLTGHVSHYCLELLGDEMTRMRELSVQVYDRCGCVLPRTHGIPCACELKAAVDSETSISLQRIHQFWRTLVIGDGVDAPDFVDGSSEDHRYFNSLIDEVQKSDPAVVRSISLLIHNEIHPQHSGYDELLQKKTGKGRPKGNTSTRRLPSAWEYRDRGCGRRSTSSSSHGRGYTSSSSVNMTSTSAGRRADIDDYQFAHLINENILPYVEGYLDVRGDGNCGFHVLADYCFGGEEQWRFARQCIANEIMVKRHLYTEVYNNDVDEAYHRILWDGGPCQSDHCMEVVAYLFPIATFFNAAVMYFECGKGTRNNFDCLTVLPLQAPSTATRPEREIVLGHLGDNYRHYIRLDLAKDFPVPLIVDMWYTLRQASVFN